MNIGDWKWVLRTSKESGLEKNRVGLSEQAKGLEFLRPQYCAEFSTLASPKPDSFEVLWFLMPQNWVVY